MAKQLTATAVLKLKSADKRREIADGGAPGLWLVIQPSGVKSWAMRSRRPTGKTAKPTLGPFDATGRESGCRTHQRPTLVPYSGAGRRDRPPARTGRQPDRSISGVCRVVANPAVVAGSFLVGVFDSAAQIFDRMELEILLSTEHGSNFTNNEITVRAEERLALAVKRPAALITGTCRNIRFRHAVVIGCSVTDGRRAWFFLFRGATAQGTVASPGAIVPSSAVG